MMAIGDILPSALRSLADEIEAKRAIGSAGSPPLLGGPTRERSGRVAAGDTIEAEASEPEGLLASIGRPQSEVPALLRLVDWFFFHSKRK